MPDFRNLSDLQKHFNTSNGTSKAINVSNVREALISEAERLQRYIIEEIDKYYQDASFKPQVYERTGRWLESVKVLPPVGFGNDSSITITFDDSLAYHDSWIGGEQGYTPWLMEVGWDVSAKFGGAINRFTQFSGTHYIKHAVERWNRDNKFGFMITVYHGDERYV